MHGDQQRHRPRRRRDDRGAITASVAVLPAVLMLFFSVVQISLWFYGRSVATTAARHGLDATRVENGSSGEGEATISQYLDTKVVDASLERMASAGIEEAAAPQIGVARSTARG